MVGLFERDGAAAHLVGPQLPGEQLPPLGRVFGQRVEAGLELLASGRELHQAVGQAVEVRHALLDRAGQLLRRVGRRLGVHGTLPPLGLERQDDRLVDRAELDLSGRLGLERRQLGAGSLELRPEVGERLRRPGDGPDQVGGPQQDLDLDRHRGGDLLPGLGILPGRGAGGLEGGPRIGRDLAEVGFGAGPAGHLDGGGGRVVGPARPRAREHGESQGEGQETSAHTRHATRRADGADGAPAGSAGAWRPAPPAPPGPPDTVRR